MVRKEFEGKVVLITGGSRGLGKAMALGFAEKGASIVVVSRKMESCVRCCEELQAYGVETLAYAAHVGDWGQLDKMVDAVYEHFGKIDVLINNAGMSPLYPSLDLVSEALFDKVISVNLKGPFRLSANIGSRMASGSGGVIINISSIASVSASPRSEPYGAAKAGLNALTKSFASELGPSVRVNCIMAGPFLTDISKAWDMDQFNQEAAKNIPLQRAGEPKEIVGLALYLASDSASYTTGAIIPVDGGAHC
ncbi:MAG: SDR family oxidoreductase [Pseudomonadales bacterium]|nr:SDR family oxidoreductase [Pseudomonadales bacterium]